MKVLLRRSNDIGKRPFWSRRMWWCEEKSEKKKEFGTVVFAQLPCQRQEITESLLRRIVGAVDATTQENVLEIESTTTWNVVVVFTQTTRRQQ